MEGKRLLRSLSLKNILSFGNEGVEIELQPLNVLIGPNGSGKSNFLEAIRLLQAAPRDLTIPISRGGGINEWLWKGKKHTPEARLQAITYDIEDPFAEEDVRHCLSLASSDQRMVITKESITQIYEAPKESQDTYSYTRWGAESFGLIYEGNSFKTVRLNIDSRKLKTNQSILAQSSEFGRFIETGTLSRLYNGIVFYTDTQFGRLTPARLPQPTDLEQTYLFEDASNLALVFNDLQNRPGVMRTIIEKLKLFNDRIENIITRVSFGTVQLYFEEKGLEQTIPATRLSDGTLRYLSLLAVLCHPEPPPLVCIEEPELGMHPDIIPTIAELLIEASQRTQLIITTHSDLLVSKMRDVPEAIIVCEREDSGTTMRRLTASELEGWPEGYSLGDLWLKGAIGGTRW